MGYTQDIGGGVGPVKIGVLLSEPEGIPNRRHAAIHPWTESDDAWASIWSDGAVAVSADRPEDWRDGEPQL